MSEFVQLKLNIGAKKEPPLIEVGFLSRDQSSKDVNLRPRALACVAKALFVVPFMER